MGASLMTFVVLASVVGALLLIGLALAVIAMAAIVSLALVVSGFLVGWINTSLALVPEHRDENDDIFTLPSPPPSPLPRSRRHH